MKNGIRKLYTETLKSVIAGAVASNKFAKEHNALLNPILAFHDKSDQNLMWLSTEQHKRIVTKVDFDVAINASSEEESKVGGGLKIQVLSLGASSSNNAVNQTSSRIKFAINVALPIAD